MSNGGSVNGQKWVPGEAHSHAYFLTEQSNRVIGKVQPNPRRHRGEATWLASAKVDGKWQTLGGTWQKADAEALVESAVKKGVAA